MSASLAVSLSFFSFRLLQLALPDFPTLIFDIFSLPLSSPDLEVVRLFLHSPRVEKVFHNGKFDLQFLQETPTVSAGVQTPTIRGEEEKGLSSSSSPSSSSLLAHAPSQAAPLSSSSSSSSASVATEPTEEEKAGEKGAQASRGNEGSDGDTRVYVQGPVFDTLIAAKLVEAGKMLGIGGYKLLQVVERFLGVLMDKSMQASDWKKRRLSYQQLLYAAR